MSIALKGFITGAFKGIGEAMDEERKQTKELLATRTKNSYQNYLKHQEQVEALKTEIKKRDAEAISFQPDLSDQERAVLATTPNLLELYKKAVTEDRRVDGRMVTIRDLLVVGDKAKGMTVENILQNIGAVQPVDSVRVGEVKPFIGVSEENQRRYLSRLSEGVGVAPEQLMAFEKAPEAPVVEPLGAIKTDVAFKPVFRSLEEKAQNLLVLIGETEDPSTKARLQEQLQQTQEAAIAHRTAMAEGKEKPERAVADITSSVRGYINTRMQDQFGVDWNKFQEARQIPLGDGSFFTSSTQKVNLPSEKITEILEAVKSYAKQGLRDNLFIDGQGVPAYGAVREVMVNFGLLGTPARPAEATPRGGADTSPAAGRAAPASTQQTRTRAEVQAVVDGINKERKEKGITPTTYEEIKRAAEAEGIRVIEK
jgi:hypothetical protein